MIVEPPGWGPIGRRRRQRIAVAVESELGIPVKFIGIGEGVNDLIRFEPKEFVDALRGE